MSRNDVAYLNASPPSVGFRGDEVTMEIHGKTYRMNPGRARVLAARLERKADMADPEGAV